MTKKENKVVLEEVMNGDFNEKHISYNTIDITMNDCDKKGNYKKHCFLIPKNVVDRKFFEFSVQYFVNIIIQEKLEKVQEKALEKAQETSLSSDKAIAKNADDELIRWKAYITNYKNIVEIYYDDLQESFNIFRSDTFAMMFAVAITNAKSINGKKIHFVNGANTVDMNELGNLVKDLNPEYTITDTRRTELVNKFNTFANENFATKNSSFDENNVYKSVTFKFTFTKLQNELFSRSKKLLKFDKNGRGVVNQQIDSLTIATQLYILCLATLGVSMIDGNKQKVLVISASTNANIKKPKRKELKKSEETKKPTTVLRKAKEEKEEK